MGTSSASDGTRKIQNGLSGRYAGGYYGGIPPGYMLPPEYQAVNGHNQNRSYNTNMQGYSNPGQEVPSHRYTADPRLQDPRFMDPRYMDPRLKGSMPRGLPRTGQKHSRQEEDSEDEEEQSSGFSNAKTIVVIAIVAGCFAVLWPKIFYPMFFGPNAGGKLHDEEAASTIPGGRPIFPYAGEPAHPALKERARMGGHPGTGPTKDPPPPPIRTVEKEWRDRGGPMPGMRPTLGAAHGMNPQHKGAMGSMSVIMPIYTVGIIIFFVYTAMKIMFRKNDDEEGEGEGEGEEETAPKKKTKKSEETDDYKYETELENLYNSYTYGNHPPYPGSLEPNPPFPENNEAIPPFPGNNEANPRFQGNSEGNTPYPGNQGGNPPYPGNQGGNPPYPGNQGSNPPYQGNVGGMPSQFTIPPLPTTDSDAIIQGKNLPGDKAFTDNVPGKNLKHNKDKQKKKSSKAKKREVEKKIEHKETTTSSEESDQLSSDNRFQNHKDDEILMLKQRLDQTERTMLRMVEQIGAVTSKLQPLILAQAILAQQKGLENDDLQSLKQLTQDTSKNNEGVAEKSAKSNDEQTNGCDMEADAKDRNDIGKDDSKSLANHESSPGDDNSDAKDNTKDTADTTDDIDVDSDQGVEEDQEEEREVEKEEGEEEEESEDNSIDDEEETD